MTQQECIFALASYAQEALVFRNMIVDLQKEIREKDERIKELEEANVVEIKDADKAS